MDKRKVGPAGIIKINDETNDMFGAMLLHVIFNEPSKSPLLEIKPKERDEGLTETLLDKLSVADEIIRYLITHMRILDHEIIPLYLFKGVMKEADRLYDAVADEAKKQNVTIKSRDFSWFKSNTLSVYRKMKGDFQFINTYHLGIAYNFSYGNEKKEFITRMVDIYFKAIDIKMFPKSKMSELMSHIE